MKKILLILVIIATFFSFQSALKKYDDLLLDNFTIVDQVNNRPFHFSISGELDADMDATANFQKDLLRLLDKYELNCYQRVYMDQEYISWVYTRDENYLSKIALTEGRLSSVRPGDYYFSNDGSEKGVIFNPIRNENFKIYHLGDFSNKHKSVFNPYELVAYGTEPEVMPLYQGFTEEFKALYPDLSVFSMLLESHGGDANKAVDYEDIIFAILTGLMVILGLNVIIVRQTKKIQILKLEGYSNWEIFKSRVLRHLGLATAVMLAADTALYLIYMETDFENTLPFLMYLAAPGLIFVVSLFVFSTVSFAAISMIDINLAVKGKSSLKRQKPLNYAMKVLLIVFTTLIVLNGVDLLTQYFRIIATEAQYVKQIDNLYNVTYFKHRYVGAMESPREFLKNHEYVKGYFKQNNDYFELMYLEKKSVDDGKITILVAQATGEYVGQYISRKTASQLEKSENYVLIPRGLENRKDLIYETLMRDNIGFDPRGLGEIVIYPEARMNNIRPEDYIRYGMNVPNMVIMVTSDELGSISNQSLFRYDGDPSEAQEYFDGVFAKFGAVSWVNVESANEQYIFWKAFFLQGFYAMLPVFLTILLAILTNTHQLAVLNCEINAKRHAILKCEGKSASALIIGEAKISALLLLVAETILYVFMDIPFRTLILVIGVFFVADILLLRWTTGMRTKHFAEMLR
jgi:hypothetical protein